MLYHHMLNFVCKLISTNFNTYVYFVCVEHASTCVHACVHCWYFTYSTAHEVVWLSWKPHLNRTIADNLGSVMRLFIGSSFSLNRVLHFSFELTN